MSSNVYQTNFELQRQLRQHNVLVRPKVMNIRSGNQTVTQGSVVFSNIKNSDDYNTMHRATENNCSAAKLDERDQKSRNYGDENLQSKKASQPYATCTNSELNF